MRSSQSHQRASNFVLERLKSHAARKYVWIDTRSQHATCFNNQHLSKTDRTATEPRRRAGNRGRGATWPVVHNPYRSRDAKPTPPGPPIRRLGATLPSAPRPPGPFAASRGTATLPGPPPASLEFSFRKKCRSPGEYIRNRRVSRSSQ
jgi:hypothetical protein